MSEFGSKRLVEMAIRYALKHCLPSVTLMHKGNIMKFTEGAFRDWGYEVARDEVRATTVSPRPSSRRAAPARAPMRSIIKDRIADSMFQQLLLRPDEYSVIATPNLNGDYISDAAAAQVGGLGIAPGGNVGDGVAVFEATHGTAPKYANLDKINPGSVILSGVMMFEYMGWNEAAKLIVRGLENAIKCEARHVRSRAPDARRDRSVDVGVRRSDHQGDDAPEASHPSAPHHSVTHDADSR